MSGKVYLIGAGPGDPELLTLRALRVLREAEVVLHDALVCKEILAFAPPRAQVVNVGKRCGRRGITQEEINALMIAHAEDGRTVARLKGGDPLVFGRAGEEMEALARAGVPFEVVPGVTAAFAAAAAARIPLTHRRRASKLFFLTGHRASESLQKDRGGSFPTDATIVVYMPGEAYDRLAADLLVSGFDVATPCLIVSATATPRQRLSRTTLAKLPQAPRLPAPAILIIGAVAARQCEQDISSLEAILGPAAAS